jgi:lipopolysaccharide export LptBFGC system permease protein LptF
MKKITLILAAFIFILSAQSYAQEASPQQQSIDQVEYNDEKRDVKKEGKREGKRIKKGKKNKAHKHAKQRRQADKKQIKAMRKVAKADGAITPNEKKVIRAEKRNMKKRDKRRAYKRKDNQERTSKIKRSRK